MRILLVTFSCLGLMAWAGCSSSNGGNSNDNTNSNSNSQSLTFQLATSQQAVAIIDPQGFEELLDLSDKEPSSVLQPIVENYIFQFAESFGNDADFLLFILDEQREQLRFNAIGGFNITVSSPELGLGTFVSTAQSFSSFPNLRSYIYLARKDSLVLGPSLHELAHAWGVWLNDSSALAEQASQSDNHWGYSSVGGQMGGWMPLSLDDLGSGQYELSEGNVEPDGRSFNTIHYAPLELYLMGLAPADEVEPIQVADNPSLTSLFEFTADGIVEVTIEDIIAENGERVPDVKHSQKNFKVSLVVLTGHELSDAEWGFYQDSMDFFSFNGDIDIEQAFAEIRYEDHPILSLIAENDPEDNSRRFINFFAATRGRATIEFIPLSPIEN